VAEKAAEGVVLRLEQVPEEVPEEVEDETWRRRSWVSIGSVGGLNSVCLWRLSRKLVEGKCEYL
jgi:hypothetical protein